MSDHEQIADVGARVKTAAEQAESLATALGALHQRLQPVPTGDVEAEEVRVLRDHSIDLQRRMQRLEDRARRLQFRLDRGDSAPERA